MTLTLRYGARSDVGLIRDINQDSVYAGPRLLAVADGMGGHAAGDVASRVVVSILATLDDDAHGGDLVDALRKATNAANEHLRAMVEGDSDLDGMGTTLTAMLFAGNRFGMVHVGDSRAYLLHDGKLEQITHDDTFVQSLVDQGRISPDEANTHPQRSLLLRVLTGQEVEPHFSVREAVPGDRYLLCSDGLSGVVSEDTIAEALGLANPQEAADRLVDLALRAGAPDNVTCVVADVVDAQVGPDEPVIAGAVADDQTQPARKTDSAAGRAALAQPARPRPPREHATDVAERRPRRLRWALAACALLAFAALGGWAGWRFVQSQYFVGADSDNTVAIFRGVSGDVPGVQLHTVQRRSDLHLADLQPAARSQVRSGITASSLQSARRIVDRLRGQQLPLCPPKESPAPARGTPSPTKAAAPVQATPASQVRTARRTLPTRPPGPAITATAKPSETQTPSPLPRRSLVPGEDCREPRR
jgi:protein phosphatase